ncbi:MAG: dihydroorotase [Patescibacteria group bacterium]|jgi:dihydroorotase
MDIINLKNCRLPNGDITDILLRNGLIEKIEPNLTAKHSIEIGKNLVIPGVIDAHVHFREPGGEQKEDWLTGAQSAAAGGVTTVIDMPNNNPPAIDEASLNNKRVLAGKSIINYGLYLGATADNIEQIKKTKDVAGVKIFVGSSTGTLLVSGDKEIEKLFSLPNIHWVIHAEDESIINANIKKYTETDIPSVHSLIRGREAAIQAVSRIIKIAKKTKAEVHICHISTAEEVELIKKAKADGLKISCEVSPHHLFLNEQSYKEFGNFVKVNPPLRTENDNQALFRALREGVIDIIATDHAPHTRDEKWLPYEKAPSGMPEVQTSLPLMLNAVNANKISLNRLIEVMCLMPSKLLKIKNKGQIAKGYDADLTVIDLEKKAILSNKDIKSKCGWSPYDGWELQGWPIMTFVGGQLVFDRGKLYSEHKGKEIFYGTI